MSGLEKATLTRLSNDRSSTEEGDPIAVQFNPASLRLTLSNNTEGGENNARQQRQFTGNASTELAFDLVFDTADEDDGSGGPRSVREKTALVEQFVLPQGTGSDRQSPPRVKFHWGELVVQGVITTITLDFDHFAEDGTPLRAKMSVSIKEQDAKYELLQAGPGSSTEGNAPPPGGAGPGSRGGGRTNRTALSLAGESAAEFAARVGLDPGAWRGLSAGLDGTLSLSAGIAIDFDASLGASFGVGISTGVEAGVNTSLEASLGLAPSGTLSAGSATGASSTAAPGFALSAAGGVTAAVETVKIARAQAATEATVKAFNAAGGASAAALKSGGGSPAVSGASAGVVAAAPPRTPAGGGSAPASAAPGAASAPTGTPTHSPPRADLRATSFGFGVPLRTQVTGAAQTRQGVVALQPYGPAREVPVTRDPTVAPWTQLPPRTPTPMATTTASPGSIPDATAPRGPNVYAPAGAKRTPLGSRTPGNGCGCG